MIRRATVADAAILSRLAIDSFVETFVEGFAIPYPPADLAVFLEKLSADRFAATIGDPAVAVWIAEADGAAVGFAVAGPCGLPHADAQPDDVELKQLYLLARAQGRGLGRVLLDTAIGWMDAQGGTQWIGVWSGNIRAQRIYAKLGFEAVGEYQFAVGDWRDDEFILRRAASERD